MVMNEETVSILMAIYRPNPEWFAAQLDSLEQQDYEKKELLVWNDSPEDDTDWESMLKEHIRSFPFKIYHGQQNLGSTKVFEKLTTLAEGEYLAYCDQDDVWHADKISRLIRLMQAQDATLACSDMRVIDGDGRLLAEHIREIRPRQVFAEGKKQLSSLLVRNFVTGCTMVVKSDIAKASRPFSAHMVHDYYLAIWNAIYGRIAICRDSLIDYRLHGSNQTATLARIATTRDYYERRILPYAAWLQEFVSDENLPPDARKQIEKKCRWAGCRKAYAEQPNLGNFLRLAALACHNVPTTCFELMLPMLSQKVFSKLIDKIRGKNR